MNQQQSHVFEEWLPQLTLTPVVDMRTWQSRAPRCAVCAIGFVRFARSIDSYSADALGYMQQRGVYDPRAADPDIQLQDEQLCLACALRRDLFRKAQCCFPRGVRQAQQLKWPFIHRPAAASEQQQQQQWQQQHRGGVEAMPSNSLSMDSTMESQPSVDPQQQQQLALAVWQDMDDALSSIGAESQAQGSPLRQNLSPQQLLHLHRSPIASSKLAEIDAMEQVKLQRRRVKQQVHHIYDYENDDDDDGGVDDDLQSLHSQGSLVSQLTESVAEESGE